MTNFNGVSKISTVIRMRNLEPGRKTFRCLKIAPMAPIGNIFIIEAQGTVWGVQGFLVIWMDSS